MNSPPPRYTAYNLCLRHICYVAVLLAVLSVTVNAAVVVPQALDASSGRLNHPVLFVPGLGGSPEHFGMNSAEPVCADPDWTAMFPTVEARQKGWYATKVLKLREFYLKVHFKLVCGGLFNVNVYREAKIGLVDEGSSFPITYGLDGRAIQAGGKTILLDEVLSFARGKYIRDLDSTAEVEAWRAYLKAADRVESYRTRSAPSILSAHFGLSSNFDTDEFGPLDRVVFPPLPGSPFVREGTGINANGIHVFQPKTWQTPVQVCQEPEPYLIGYSGGSIRDYQNQDPFHISSVAAMRLQFALRCRGIPHPNSTRIIVLKFDGDFGIFANEAAPDEAETFETGGWVGSVEPLAGMMLRLHVGSMSRLYDYSHAADQLSYPLPSAYLPSEDVLPTWENVANNIDGGQANQLYLKMQMVLDEHYGAGHWENDPTAQIDLVAHSQGGLVIREMIANATIDDARNPISHIRQILTINSPLHGTALATAAEILAKPAEELDADLGQKSYPELASLRQHITDETICRNYPHRTGCLTLKTQMPFKVKLGTTGTGAVQIGLHGSWLGPYALWLNGFDLSYLPSGMAPNLDFGLRKKMAKMSSQAEHLGWPQSSAYITNLVKSPNNQEAPRYPGSNTFIPFTTLSSGSVGNFVTQGVTAVTEGIRNACPAGSKMFQKELEGYGITAARVWAHCSDLHTALDQIEGQLLSQLSGIDEGWSKQGDMFVDYASQRASRKLATTWDPIVNRQFNPASFNYNTNILHGPFDADLDEDINPMDGFRFLPFRLHALFSGASMQGCDILDQLGVVDYSRLGCAEPAHQGFKPFDPFTAVIELLGTVNSQMDEYNKRNLRIRNTTSSTMRSVRIDVPVFTDPKAKPQAHLIGAPNATVTMEKVGEGAWIARIRTTETISKDATWPNESGFQLVVSDPTGLPVRIGVGSTGSQWQKTVQVRVSTPDGVTISGIDPVQMLKDYSDKIGSSPSVDVEASGYQSRGTDLVWTKPVLTLENASDRKLVNFDIVYRVQGRSGVKPEVLIWNIPQGAGTVTAEVVANGAAEWMIVFHFRNASLMPGQTLRDFKFGAHWPDWATWDVTLDPSEPGSVTGADMTLTVFDVEALGIPQTAPPEATTWRIEGYDEGVSDPVFVKPRLRLINTGASAITGFTLRIPVVAPAGITPVLETWYAPGCSGRMEGIGSALSVVYSCPSAHVEPGATWPDVSGMAFGFHDSNWGAWVRGNDVLTRELGANWARLSSPQVSP